RLGDAHAGSGDHVVGVGLAGDGEVGEGRRGVVEALGGAAGGGGAGEEAARLAVEVGHGRHGQDLVVVGRHRLRQVLLGVPGGDDHGDAGGGHPAGGGVEG